MQRRELFQILTATAVAARGTAGQHQHPPPSTVPNISAYHPRFFSESEYQTVDRLCDIVIPADPTSGGAHQAGVSFYIDTTLHYAATASRQSWRAGLAAVDEAARSMFSKPFASCERLDQEQVVARMARNEPSPETALEKFFAILKRAAVDAYMLSDIGMRDYLGYKGDAVLTEFPGCTHPDHQT